MLAEAIKKPERRDEEVKGNLAKPGAATVLSCTEVAAIHPSND